MSLSHDVQFLERGGLPRARVRCVVLSPVEEEVTLALCRIGVEVLQPSSCNGLLKPERYHTDLLFRHPGGETVFLEPGQTELAETVRQHGGHPVLTTRPLKCEYPCNVGLNVLICGSVLFARLDAVADELLDFAQHHGLRLHHIHQGYAGCAGALVDERAIMTSDIGLARAAAQEGIDCLLLTPGHIRCKGFDTGFIGGCCGKLAPDILAFTGNPNRHPDGNRMEDFCRQHGVTILSLTDDELCDIGGIVPLMEDYAPALANR